MFTNLRVGPVVALDDIRGKKVALEDLLERDCFVVAYITRKTHPIFEMFKDEKVKPKAVIITVEYIKNYE